MVWLLPVMEFTTSDAQFLRQRAHGLHTLRVHYQHHDHGRHSHHHHVDRRRRHILLVDRRHRRDFPIYRHLLLFLADHPRIDRHHTLLLVDRNYFLRGHRFHHVEKAQHSGLHRCHRRRRHDRLMGDLMVGSVLSLYDPARFACASIQLGVSFLLRQPSVLHAPSFRRLTVPALLPPDVSVPRGSYVGFPPPCVRVLVAICPFQLRVLLENPPDDITFDDSAHGLPWLVIQNRLDIGRHRESGAVPSL
mmetsp:Transcript_7204/g.10530  ORF Transcript_7204/g.10530 Transcript_7204/m.10530 type:complete len:248 (-) Transcript_7204:2631-3374(-)